MSMDNMPKEPPHVVAEAVVELAKTYGYSFREIHLVYFDGIDEYLTVCKQSEELWRKKSGA